MNTTEIINSDLSTEKTTITEAPATSAIQAVAVSTAVAGVAALATEQAHAAVAITSTSKPPADGHDAWRFLTQATFGPTEADLHPTATLKNKGYVAWLNEQFLKQPKDTTYNLSIKNQGGWHLDGDGRTPGNTVKVGGETTVSAIWEQFLSGHDQLRQRVAFALSEILVVSLRGIGEFSLEVASYHDLLVKNAFGSFRTLLRDVCRHPAMGHYLSHWNNKPPYFTPGGTPDPVTGRYPVLAIPDQNFARELMQLFTIGLVKLNMDGSPVRNDQGEEVPTYTQHDVEMLSYVFTGWFSTIDWTSFPEEGRDQFNHAMLSDAATPVASMEEKKNFYWPPMRKLMSGNNGHARPTDFSKGFGNTPLTLLGDPFVPKDDALQDMDQALDILLRHQNVAPFIARQMIQRLVTSNPSKAYVRRVATQFKASNLSLKTLVQAILLDTEARDAIRIRETGLSFGLNFGKMRETVLRVTAALRALNCHTHRHFTDAQGATPAAAKPVYIFEYTYKPSTNRFDEAVQNPGQGPYQAASVFNFFRPGYIVPGGTSINAPELQAASPVELTTYVDFVEAMLMAGGCGKIFSLTPIEGGNQKTEYLGYPGNPGMPFLSDVPYANPGLIELRFGVYIKLNDELSNLDAGSSNVPAERFNLFIAGLSKKFVGGMMSSSMQDKLKVVLGLHFGADGQGISGASPTERSLAIRQCLLLVLISAEFVIQK